MPSPNSPRSSARAADLDLLKTLLVYGMIGAHVVQLITLAPRADARGFSDFINLVTFSGFMFAFGIGVGLPRGNEGRKRSLWQRVRPVLLSCCLRPTCPPSPSSCWSTRGGSHRRCFTTS
jgi:uncharacterized membrane protein